MKLFCFRRPPHKLASDIADVMRDPIGVLGRGQVTIADQPLAVWVILVGAVGLLFLIPDPRADVVALRYICLGVVPVVFVCAVVWKRRVILSAQGVEYVYGRRSVFIPWPLFDPSTSYVAQGSWLKLAVNGLAVSAIEHRRDGVAVAYGMGQRSQYLGIGSEGVVAIYVPVGVAPEVLGELILHLVRTLPAQSRSAPRVSVPRSEDSPVWRLADGSLEVLQTHLVFPPICCECERPTEDRLELQFSDWVGKLQNPILPICEPLSQTFTASVPYCAQCQRLYRRRSRRRGLALTALLTLPGWGVILVLWHNHAIIDLGAMFLGIFWLVVCGVIGFAVGKRPAVRGHLPWRKSVIRLQCLRPTYADYLFAWLTRRRARA